MEDMIRRIIDMDKQAQEIIDAAQREKLESEHVVAEKADQLRDEVLTRARRRIQINRELENTILEQEWSGTKSRYDRQLEDMDKMYAEHGQEWVDGIVARVLKG